MLLIGRTNRLGKTCSQQIRAILQSNVNNFDMEFALLYTWGTLRIFLQFIKHKFSTLTKSTIKLWIIEQHILHVILSS